MPDLNSTPSEQGWQAINAIREFIAARDNLEVAPTHNGAVFDAALERHNAAVESLRMLAEARGAS
ncbi:hypothetical protein SKP52_02795 [Sphingopyxis fribergensis]|uniref:Uncharacterized protein n=1 Tax=Sphingopyxis fribergensis TaxID=1515612 RepID=A0A0A7PC01_9SPHN|nr:hypothetical protein SKP52_02795 [Sphingopyxis fribergensis]